MSQHALYQEPEIGAAKFKWKSAIVHIIHSHLCFFLLCQNIFHEKGIIRFVFSTHDSCACTVQYVVMCAGVCTLFLPLLCEVHVASGNRALECSPCVVCSYYDILEATW